MKFLMMMSIAVLALQAPNGAATASVLPDQVLDSELARLPPYCAARMKMPQDSPEARAWRSQIGQNFVDFFHYCSGLNYLNRYWGARTVRERNYYLQQARAEFDYMVNAMRPDFTMAAELFANRAEALKLMGKTGDAVRDFTQAIAITPTLVRPYLQLADVYSQNGDRTRALETITNGLRYVPESTALQRRYVELGGKAPFPEPIVSKAAEKTSEPEIPGESKPAVPPGATLPQPAPQTETAPALGTPKNPYCRFCPPE